MKEGYWVVRTVRSGNVIEKSQFYLGERRPRAKRRKGSTSAARKDANMNTAIRQLARTVNCNFEAKDLLLTFTYDEAHYADIAADAQRAEKCMTLAWRRLRRALAALGVQLRGFWTTADKDAETGERVRLHHHAVIGAEGVTVAFDEAGELTELSVGGRSLTSLWGMGTAHAELLREQDDYTPIAVYLLRQAVGGENAKKWHASRGLEKPVVESERIVACPRELRAPGGAAVSEIGRYDSAGGTHYIRYVRKKRPAKVGGHKEEQLWKGESEAEEGRTGP